MLLAPRFWYQKSSLLAYLLSPAALLYRAITLGHRNLYRFGIKKTRHFSIPVIVVGNITVGGVGKTPFVIWLANWLKSQGYHPGIVSRGYGGSANQHPQIVTENSDPHWVGDEAILLRYKTQCPMVIAANRPRAVEKLIADFDCNIVISDDGLQHHALARDVEIVIVDAHRKFGNNFCLPAGPLRESTQRLKTVDFVINNGSANEISEDYFKIAVNDVYQINNLQNKLNLQSFANQRVHAVAGIGDPQRFFQQLKHAGIQIIEHAFPDHHGYQKRDLNFDDNLPILMTEKDAVKCRHFVDDRYWCVPINVEVPQVFIDKLQKSIFEKC
jgi:tetraacyldisaccharide 4'-kinase